ncbi:MAG: 2-dehydro-3-deoxygalactonokinase [Pseudomonadota bacterium]|nr:2-dehydro-3-deoxygalactonokinase [Pseudomonadota bacterium]
MSESPALLALDWGTSSLRAYLLAAGERPRTLDARSAAWGIMNLPEGGYPQALAQLCGDWLERHPRLPLLAAGMVGSAQGWREAPYVSCPAGAGQLAAGLVEVPDARLRIVPGVLQAGGLPNVMRGEETQIVGALALEDRREGLYVLPGTHSKWAQVEDAAIQNFATFMTGELFAVLRKHTILGRLMDAGAPPPGDDAGFRRGVEVALHGGHGGLPAVLFTVRTLGLTRQLDAAQLPDYLSGLLIGAELAGALELFGEAVRRQPLTLIGDPRLCARYQAALSQAGFAPARTLEQATEAGLWQIARAAGLLGPAGAA